MAQDDLQSIVQRMVSAGESEEDIALVIKHYQPATPTGAPDTAPAKPLPAAALPQILGQKIIDLVRNHPVETAATAGAIAAVPLTGGTSLLPMAAAAGLGGAGGAGLGLIGQAAVQGKGPTSASGVAGEMATQGALQAAGEGLGPLVGGTLRMAGRGLYRGAALPINQLAKYGDLIAEGLEKRIPVSKSGLAKASGLADAAKGAKAAALTNADTRATHLARGVADDARSTLRVFARKDAKAGLGNRMADFEAQLDEFVANNPDGTLTPSALDEVKRTWDDASGGAYQKLRKKEPLSPQERFTVEMGQAASRAQQDVIPQYRALNKDVMTAEGVKRLIGRRVNPGSSGGNQGLENAMTMLGGIGALPARLMMLPPVLSRLGIGAHVAGTAADAALPNAYRAALLALLGRSDDQPQPE